MLCLLIMYYFYVTSRQLTDYLKHDSPEYFLPVSTIQLLCISVSLYILVPIVLNKMHGMAFVDTISTIAFVCICLSRELRITKYPTIYFTKKLTQFQQTNKNTNKQTNQLTPVILFSSSYSAQP